MERKDEILTFSLAIEKIAKEKKLMYIDAIVHYCELTGLEIELASKMINGSLKSKIKLEAEKLHFLPKPTTKRLPV